MATIKVNRFSIIKNAIQRKTAWDAVFLKNLPLESGSEVMKDLYSKSHLAYVCISTTARALSQVPLVVQKWDGKKWNGVPNHPLQLLFDKPNIVQSTYLFKESIFSFLLLDGNVWVLPFPPGLPTPKQLWVIRRKNIEKIMDNGNFVGWTYRPNGVNGRGVALLAEEMAHVKFFNPNDPVFGQAPSEAGKLPIQADFKAASYNEVFFDNGAVPGGALYTEKLLPQTQFDRTKEQFETRHQGYRNAHRFAILEGGLKYQEMGLTQADMEFINLRKWSRDEILQIYGMKKAILSITEDINYSTNTEQKKEWWNSTLIPLAKLVEAEFNRILLGSVVNENFRVAFDFLQVDALQDQFKDKVEMASRLYGMGCTFEQVNERLQLGFEVKPWQKIGYMPLSNTPIGDDGLPLISTGPGFGEESFPPRQITDAKFRIVEDKDTEPLPELSPRQKMLEARWKSYIGRVTPLERRFERKVTKVFFEMRIKVIKMTGPDKSMKADPQSVVSPEELMAKLRAEEFPVEKDLLQKYSMPIYEGAVKEGADAFIQEMGLTIAFDLKDPAALAFLGMKPIKIRHVVDTIKKQCLNACQAGADNGESIDQIAQRLRDVFTMSSRRAKMIARTEVIGASNFGRHAAMRESGFEMKEWYTAMDERVRETHQDMQGQKVAIDQPWIVGGASLQYPGDWAGPAEEVINCRCIEVILPGSEKPEE